MDTDTFDVSDDVLEARHAAARDMLAALQQAVFYMECVAGQDRENGIVDGNADVDLDAARQALALARAAGISPDKAEG